MPRTHQWPLLCLGAAALCSPHPLPAEPPLKFATAAIAVSSPDSNDVWLIPESGGGFRARNVTAWRLIKNAYYLRDPQLTGGPGWVQSERYDITAAPETPEPQGANAAFTESMDRHRNRLRTLLSDRFGLVLRAEKRVQPHYSLKMAPSGVKMEPAGAQILDPIVRVDDGGLAATTDARGLAALLTDLTGRLVVDDTGLTGNHHVRLRATTEDTEAMLIAAVRDQLGLLLEPKTGPVTVHAIAEIRRPVD